jgi:hypothetical protein
VERRFFSTLRRFFSTLNVEHKRMRPASVHSLHTLQQYFTTLLYKTTLQHFFTTPLYNTTLQQRKKFTTVLYNRSLRDTSLQQRKKFTTLSYNKFTTLVHNQNAVLQRNKFTTLLYNNNAVLQHVQVEHETRRLYNNDNE